MNLLWTQGRHLCWLLISLAGLGLLAIFIVSPIFSYFLWALVLVLFFFFLYFYRNPDRVPDTDNANQLICPADGTVIAVQLIEQGKYAQRVSIFLSPLDVHVQWIPMRGIIEEIRYKMGKFTAAFLKKSEYNEQNEIVIRGTMGTISVRQIAGVVARRISCWVTPGQQVAQGAKYGMIHFGSRVDVLLPAGVVITVRPGQRVRGGATQLGVWQCLD